MEVHNKRSREQEADISPEAKRIHADLLQNILSEDDSEAGECNPDLATVMKSLEQEIALAPETEAKKEGMEYLQEASDDELGIPPAMAAGGEDGGEETAEGFGRIWVYEDEGIPAWYEGVVELGFLTEGYGEGEDEGVSAVWVDGGIGDGMGW